MKMSQGPESARSNATAFVASVASNPLFMRFRALPMGRDLPVNDAMELFSCFEEQDFRKGEDIYVAGSSSARTVYMILQGAVSVQDASGNFYTTLRAGDVFGLFSFLDNRPHSVSVSTLEDMVVLSMPRAYFDVITLEDPLLGNRLLQFMFNLLSRMSLMLECEYAALREYRLNREMTPMK